MLSIWRTLNVWLSLYIPPLTSVLHDLKYFLQSCNLYDIYTPNWTQFVLDCSAIIHVNVHACVCVCVHARMCYVPYQIWG